MNTKSLLFISALVMNSAAVQAQGIMVKGKVVDQHNEPIIGATVGVDKGKAKTVTDIDGNYTLQVPANAQIVVNYIGMKPVTQNVGGRRELNFVLQDDVNQIQDVVVVGYGTQKRGSITGSVAAVKGDEMIRTKNENPQNMLTGRVAGVRVWQKSSEPGSYNNNFDVRGMGTPLVIIDGVPRDMSDFQRMNADDIQDISVLKDASASIYGLRSANGVVLVTTKKGQAGKTKFSYNGSYTIQSPKSMPKLLDAYKTMTLYNERNLNNVNGGSKIYTDEMFDEFRNGTRRETDWNNLIFAKTSPQTNHNITVSGGNDKTQYFVSFGAFYQEGFFKSGDLNYHKYNITSNLTTEVYRGLKLSLNINAMTDKQNNPYCTSADIIRNYWRQGVLFPAYADEAGTMLNYDGLDLEENTVAKMTADISGYRRYKQSQVLTSGIFEYDFGTLTNVLKGLKAKVMFSYDYHLNNNTIYRKQYYQYAYDPATQTYKQKLYASSAPSNLRREHYDTQQFLSQYTLSYNRDFGPHSIAAVVGMETQRRTGDNFYAMRNLAFSSPYLFNGVEEGQVANSATGGIYSANYNAFIGRLNYSFAQRYLIEGQFRYDGSSKFAKGHRWGFFPSVSLGWVVSEEPWFKNIEFLKGVDQLKLRASYGEMGDDSGANYDWVAGYTYPSTSGNSEKGYYNQYAPGFIFGSQFVYAATPMAIPNELISWYKAKTFNVGVDFNTNNQLFGFSLDYFSRKMTGLYEYRTSEFPTVIGANPPRENANSSRNFGMELELRHHNRIGRNFVYNVKGIVTITRQKYLTAIQNGPYANAYDQWRNDHLNNRYQGVQFGYEGNGRYQNWDEIWNETLYHEKDLLPGDYKYLDWNGDGEINSQDEHPYAFDQTPWMNYSLSIDCAYKGFDFSMLWQGSALGSMSYEEPLYSIWGQNGGGALEQYWDRWHPADENADPYDPNTKWVKGYYAYTGHYPSANSTFNRVSTAYLRLKQIELGYTLPKWKAFPSLNLRVYANAYNLFTITGVKFVDPEHPSDDLGRLYPLNRTYTFGVQVSF
ncbi:TonB-dependent receptor [uncultured Prevotella sp.]|uniref:SusC/RagA family TonB-linked outer membrane protein n=1 Tax=uncultured Prevotella sp. TaxID=159272 RepID=UPI0025CD5EBC|nr:TonB-dependent receptor [uncultured Prevotella sp.]